MNLCRRSSCISSMNSTKECILFHRKVKLSTYSSLVLVSYLHICVAARSSRLRVSSQRASVKSDESPSSRPEPLTASVSCFVGAKENGGNFGDHAEEARERGHRPACNCGQTVKGSFSHSTCFYHERRHKVRLLQMQLWLHFWENPSCTRQTEGVFSKVLTFSLGDLSKSTF